MTNYQYRVVSKRGDYARKVAVFATLEAAKRRVGLLTSDKPWEALGQYPDELVCCSGYSCGCGGATYKEHHEQYRATLPELKSAHIERRQVGEWEPLP